MTILGTDCTGMNVNLPYDSGNPIRGVRSAFTNLILHITMHILGLILTICIHVYVIFVFVAFNAILQRKPVTVSLIRKKNAELALYNMKRSRQ